MAAWAIKPQDISTCFYRLRFEKQDNSNMRLVVRNLAGHATEIVFTPGGDILSIAEAGTPVDHRIPKNPGPESVDSPSSSA